jgi:Raf kinase inhibitor-like YbhB/YbcL family protein
MTKKILASLAFIFLTVQTTSSLAAAFDLKSKDITPGSKIKNDFIFNGMDCKGDNKSPELHWSGAPKGTKSFAVTLYDPDAPTGSGFWHWVIINIPATQTSLPQSWKTSGTDGTEITSDFGMTTYGGPCPPPGKPHRYIFTVHALKTDKIDLPAGGTNAFARFMVEGSTIKKAQLKASYGR